MLESLGKTSNKGTANKSNGEKRELLTPGETKIVYNIQKV